MNEKGNALAPRPFADVVRELAGGSTYHDLTEMLGQVVAGVIHHRKAGKLTLELTIQPNGEHSVTVHDNIKVKIPEGARTSSVFFVRDGALMREDPRQERLPLRSIETPPTRTIDGVVNSEPPRSVPEQAAQPLRTVG